MTNSPVAWREVSRKAENRESKRTYLCIDLKTFYASVECHDRGLDPLEANLVVADRQRGASTICLAVSSAMKAQGIRNRCRLHEIPAGIDFIIARPRMARYMEVSADVYDVYLDYVSPDDMHPYSIDECFIDATPYLALYATTAEGFARLLIEGVWKATGIRATAGIGPNLFLAKTALDIMAKHAADGIACVDEASFEETIALHRPITDIWNIGKGIARRLERYRAFDLRGVAQMDEDVLYREFGANAEYLIDHAHGREPCTIREIKEYVPKGSSMTSSQVLPRDYRCFEAFLVVREMVDDLALELVEKDLCVSAVSLYLAHFDEGSSSVRASLPCPTDSPSELMEVFADLFASATKSMRLVRRVSIGFDGLVEEGAGSEQLRLFETDARQEEERRRQRTIASVRDRFGKNALVKGSSLLESATAMERHRLIGGHRA